MSTKSKKLSLDAIEEIIRPLIESSPSYISLNDEVRKCVTLGTSIKNNVVRCMAYIPGVRPELGKILVAYDVDRSTGEVTVVPESDW